MGGGFFWRGNSLVVGMVWKSGAGGRRYFNFFSASFWEGVFGGACSVDTRWNFIFIWHAPTYIWRHILGSVFVFHKCIGAGRNFRRFPNRSEEHTSELQSQSNLVCRLLLEKKK